MDGERTFLRQAVTMEAALFVRISISGCQRTTFATHTVLVGGGRWPRPGEISLSHRGVLFLDELPEFGHADLEVLRQPPEDKVVTISRAQGSVTFPANFFADTQTTRTSALQLASRTPSCVRRLHSWT
jgi:predicted ATPase with chaperone activity